MSRIAIGGVQHETNTFAASRATFDDFVRADAWPGMCRGGALLDAVQGINLPIAGFVEQARRDGHVLKPLMWCAAQPSGPVTRDAFERIACILLEDLSAALPVDAVYLDLHGAMVTEHLDDADGELLARVRERVGTAVPVVATLDLHANVSRAMLEQASALLSYRTYPHVDMAETGARASLLIPRLIGRPPLQRALEHLDFLVPLTAQCTLIEPGRSVMAHAAELEARSFHALHYTPGFPLADVYDCGPCVFGYGDDGAQVRDAVAALAAEAAAGESELGGRFWSIEAAIRRVLEVRSSLRGPVILVDTQDNPGAGGNGDSTSLIKALITARAEGVVAGLICDPEVALQAHGAGTGAGMHADLGAKSGFPGETPISGEFRIDALGDGRFAGTGPFYLGAHMDLGPMALLRVDGVRIAVASRKQQAADQAMFRHLGVQPAEQRVLVLKSSVHFRADFGALASEILIVLAPGPSPADPARLSFRKLRPGVRTAAAAR
ncbi:MAG TPA: M81 family metallopeptidase [Steroidobacteraceae bacterium]|nr:M81 family metallopeptidase [Steroidobacteraceae bacterium]